MRIAVTGAGGLIGAHAVRAGIGRGHDVTAIVRPGGRRDALAGSPARLVEADMLGESRPLVAALTGAETVIHCAAVFAYGRAADDLRRIAVEGTRRLLAAAKEAGAGRVVVTSSSVVFGYTKDGAVLDESSGLADPAGQPAYVAAKIEQDLAALELADALGLELVLACPTMSVGPIATTLGPSNGLIVAYLADPSRSTFPGGCNIVSAEDVGAGHVILAERGEPGGHYLIGGENLPWRDIHARIGELAGVGGPHLTLGREVAWLAAAAEEARAALLGGPSLSTREQAGMIGRFYWYDSRRAAALGYSARPADTALLEAVSWLAGSAHVSREVRATMRLSDEVQRFRYGAAA